MNEIVKNFVLAGDNFMPDMHLNQSRFTYNIVKNLIKTKRKFKNLIKQEIQDISIKTN